MKAAITVKRANYESGVIVEEAFLNLEHYCELEVRFGVYERPSEASGIPKTAVLARR